MAGKTELTFEVAMKELESIVRKLEGGTADLEASIADYTRGMQLKEFCEGKLKEAKLKVESIVTDGDSNIKTKAFDNPQ